MLITNNVKANKPEGLKQYSQNLLRLPMHEGKEHSL
jgi:hypothetical protein